MRAVSTSRGVESRSSEEEREGEGGAVAGVGFRIDIRGGGVGGVEGEEVSTEGGRVEEEEEGGKEE